MPENEKSTYQTISDALELSGKLPNNFELPDESSFYGEQELRFTGGAFESILPLSSSQGFLQKIKTKRIIRSIYRCISDPTKERYDSMHKILADRNSIQFLDHVMQEMSLSDSQQQALKRLARNLLKDSRDRNVIKYAIYFLTDDLNKEDYEVLEVLSRHDEFTVHIVRLLANKGEQANEIIFDIAKHVDGWGKIHAVSYLQPATDEIKIWLIRKGCENNIMNSYLAMECAKKGQMIVFLRNEVIDSDLFRGAGIIIRALHDTFGPNETIESYENNFEAVQHYLNHAERLASSLEDLLSVAAIRDYPSSQDYPDLLDKCNHILNRDDWKPLVIKNIDSDDAYLKFLAISAADKLQIDIWQRLFDMLQSDSINSSLYFDLAKTGDVERFQRLADFAENTLPFKQIETGPANELGLGLEYSAHLCLSTIVQFVEDKPGIGTRLIEAALWSPVVNNRSMAINALKTWPNNVWSDRIKERINQLSRIEPNKGLRAEIKSLQRAMVRI